MENKSKLVLQFLKPSYTQKPFLSHRCHGTKFFATLGFWKAVNFNVCNIELTQCLWVFQLYIYLINITTLFLLNRTAFSMGVELTCITYDLSSILFCSTNFLWWGTFYCDSQVCPESSKVTYWTDKFLVVWATTAGIN